MCFGCCSAAGQKLAIGGHPLIWPGRIYITPHPVSDVAHVARDARLLAVNDSIGRWHVEPEPEREQ